MPGGRGFLGKLRTGKATSAFLHCRDQVFENRLLKQGYVFDSCKPAIFKLNTEKLHDYQWRPLNKTPVLVLRWRISGGNTRLQSWSNTQTSKTLRGSSMAWRLYVVPLPMPSLLSHLLMEPCLQRSLISFNAGVKSSTNFSTDHLRSTSKPSKKFFSAWF